MTRVLFRPPVVSTYSDVQGEILFITKNVQTNLGEMWQEPLIYLTTKTKNCIPAVHLKRPGARFTILMSHANMEDLGIAVRCAAELAVDLEEDLFVYEYSGEFSTRLTLRLLSNFFVYPLYGLVSKPNVLSSLSFQPLLRFAYRLRYFNWQTLREKLLCRHRCCL